MDRYEEIERNIMTSYRKRIWNKFTKAIKDYELIKEGDKIAVCISGGKDSMLMAKCFQELKRHGKVNFDVIYLVDAAGSMSYSIEKVKTYCVEIANILKNKMMLYDFNFGAVFYIDPIIK